MEPAVGATRAMPIIRVELIGDKQLVVDRHWTNFDPMIEGKRHRVSDSFYWMNFTVKCDTSTWDKRELIHGLSSTDEWDALLVKGKEQPCVGSVTISVPSYHNRFGAAQSSTLRRVERLPCLINSLHTLAQTLDS